MIPSLYPFASQMKYVKMDTLRLFRVRVSFFGDTTSSTATLNYAGIKVDL